MAPYRQGLATRHPHRTRSPDLAFVEASKFGVDDVARLFGVPSWILQNGQTITFASSREASRNFATLTLAPWCRPIEAAFQATVLGAPYRLRFDLGALTKSDVDAYSAYACELVEQCEGVFREAEFPITFIVLFVIGAMTVNHQTVETHDAGLHQGVQRVNE